MSNIHNIWKQTGLSPAQGGFIALGLIGLIVSYPQFSKYQAQIQQDKDAIAKVQSQRRELQIQLLAEKEQAAIANERYKSCLPVVGEVFKNGTHYFVGIKPGVVIRDRISNKPMTEGTVICDANGNTARIAADGTPQHFAYTGDRNVVATRLKHFRGSQFSQPVIGE
jgi:hypothetical protein